MNDNVKALGDKEGLNDARGRLAAIPGFSAESAKAARIKRLPGLTNRVYRVELAQGRFALRIPGAGTAAIIDRRVEEANARAAAEAGAAPDVLHFGTEGVMLTRFIDGAEPVTAELLAERPDALERVGRALRHLHDAKITFAGRFEAFATIDRYRSILARRAVALAALQCAILESAEPLRAALAVDPPALRPCHCDPTGHNLLDTGTRVWLVDWEYSGMNDPAWDIAYFSVQSHLDPEADAALLSAYFEQAPTAAEAARVAVTKAPVELMSALWALIQESAGNRAADFQSYAATTFELAAKRMQSPAFAASLAALGKR